MGRTARVARRRRGVISQRIPYRHVAGVYVKEILLPGCLIIAVGSAELTTPFCRPNRCANRLAPKLQQSRVFRQLATFVDRARIVANLGAIIKEVPVSSKYPPAEPEALRLLAPQRGLIATAEKQKQLQRHEAREATGFGKTKATAGGILPEFSKFDCLPGRAGGTPISLDADAELA